MMSVSLFHSIVDGDVVVAMLLFSLSVFFSLHDTISDRSSKWNFYISIFSLSTHQHVRKQNTNNNDQLNQLCRLCTLEYIVVFSCYLAVVAVETNCFLFWISGERNIRRVCVSSLYGSHSKVWFLFFVSVRSVCVLYNNYFKKILLLLRFYFHSSAQLVDDCSFLLLLWTLAPVCSSIIVFLQCYVFFSRVIFTFFQHFTSAALLTTKNTAKIRFILFN